MISSQFIIVAGIITAMLWVPAGLRLYKRAIPLHWLFAVAFIFGSLGISVFYFEIEYSVLFGINLVMVSRMLWSMILLTTSLIAVSVLVFRR